MDTVSDWIDSCATFDRASYGIHQRNQAQHQQQLSYHLLQQDAPHHLPHQQRQPLSTYELHQLQQQLQPPYRYASLTNVQTDINSDILVGMDLSAASSSSSSSQAPNGSSEIMNNDNNNNNMSSTTTICIGNNLATAEYLEPTSLLPHLRSNNNNNNNNNINSHTGTMTTSSSLLEIPMISMADSGGLVSDGLDLVPSNNDVHSHQQSSPIPIPSSSCAYPSTSNFAAMVNEMAVNPMGASEQFQLMMCSWSLCNPEVVTGTVDITSCPTTLSPSLSSSPALSSSSAFTTSSTSPIPPLSIMPYPASSPFLSSTYPFLKSNNHKTSNNNSNLTSSYFRNLSSLPSSPRMTTKTHKFTPRSPSMLTRRRSQALALQAQLSSSASSSLASSATISSTLFMTDSMSRTPSASPFITSSPSPSSSSSSSPCLPTYSSPASIPSTITSSSSSSSPSVPPLTCAVCRKRYANNSTLRRHLKIHAYANSSSHAMSLLRSSTVSTTPILQSQGARVGQYKPLLCSGVSASSLSGSVESQRQAYPVIKGSIPSSTSSFATPSSSSSSSSSSLSSSLSSSSSSSSSMILGYNPSSDPDIKKPECVGCNKAFARRDTVILHIKNQKRKWDLLNAMLPTLTGSDPKFTSSSERYTTMISSPSSLTDSSVVGFGLEKDTLTSSVPISVSTTTMTTTTMTTLTPPPGRKAQRQRRSHPYRMVEKLWQSTMQRKGLVLASSSLCLSGFSNNMSTSCASLKNTKRSEGEVDSGIGEDSDKDADANSDSEADVSFSLVTMDEEEDETMREDKWPSLEVMAKLDSQTKLKWMMRMMVTPPCWTERKVRLFGAFGVLEEKVLQ